MGKLTPTALFPPVKDASFLTPENARTAGRSDRPGGACGARALSCFLLRPRIFLHPRKRFRRQLGKRPRKRPKSALQGRRGIHPRILSQRRTQGVLGASAGGFRQTLRRPLTVGVLLHLPELPLVERFHRRLDGADGVEQVPVERPAVLAPYHGRLGADEIFLLQAAHILADCVFAHAQRLADGLVAGPALIGFSVLDAQQVNNDKLRLALSLTDEWAKVEPESAMITGVAVVNAEFAQQNPEAVQNFLSEYQASTEYVNANPQEASVWIEEADIAPAAVAEKAVPQCNIVCITGTEMKEKAEGYLNALYEQNPKAVGGQLPDEAFYFAEE